MNNAKSSAPSVSGHPAVPARRGFLGSALGGVSALLSGLVLAGCSGTARSGSSQSPDEPQDGETPAESCVSNLTGLELRAVEEGEAVTMDYREDRLTLVLDEHQRITQAYIG